MPNRDQPKQERLVESDQSARLRMADIATSTNAWIGWRLSIVLRVSLWPREAPSEGTLTGLTGVQHPRLILAGAIESRQCPGADSSFSVAHRFCALELSVSLQRDAETHPTRDVAGGET